MWTARTRRWALRVLPPQKLLPTANLPTWPRGCTPSGSRPSQRSRWRSCRASRSRSEDRLVADQQRRPLLQQPSPVERRDVHGVHGDPPVGQILDGRMARQEGPDLDHRCPRIRVLGRRGFTGYLSQQNFDSQWISTNGKDAFNAAGVGAFFNLMNFGQMLLWHVVLIPIVLVALVGVHVLFVRIRGVAHPLPVAGSGHAATLPPTPRQSRSGQRASDAAEWRGPTRRYDIAKEATSRRWSCWSLRSCSQALLSSPDVPSITIRTWAQVAPADFLGTAASELAAPARQQPTVRRTTTKAAPSSASGSRGRPWPGSTIPSTPPNRSCSAPLSHVAFSDHALATALSEYRAASSSTHNCLAQRVHERTQQSDVPERGAGGAGRQRRAGPSCSCPAS